MKLFNSLNRQVEELEMGDGEMGVYTCGPTVYSYVTIGNWRTYTLGDLVVRVLRMNGKEVNYVMNITDVGHLTGDNLGDANTGEDRLEKAAIKENKTAWDVAAHYTNDFLYWYEKLNLSKPSVFCKATDYIEEQINLIKQLEERGLTYLIGDGVYFDVRKYEEMGFEYGKLSTLDQIQAGARVEVNQEKKDARDFALWKFSQAEEKRHMEWDSPWGKGFPGWHIECSAMSMKYLGEQFEVHVGGEDLRSTHHPNEIAQSQGATGKEPFVKYWVHGAFLLVDGGRMGKSLGNAYNMVDVVDRGYDPLALRYFYFTGHYRKQLNFSWDGLSASATTLRRLREKIAELRKGNLEMKENFKGQLEEWNQKFMSAVNDDLDMPRAIAIVWDLVRSDEVASVKYELVVNNWDKVLGLDLDKEVVIEIDSGVEELVKKRDEARVNKDWQKSDEIRDQLMELGYEVEDGAEGTRVFKK